MKRSTWIILGLIAVLGLIYLLTREEHISVGVKRLKLPTFSQDNVDRVEIKSKDDVVLVKQDGKWLIELPDSGGTRFVRADQSNVSSLLDAALSVRHSHYVTNMKEKFKELGLEGEESTLIKISASGTPVWQLVLGKNAVGSGRYAKTPEDNDVYVVRGSFWQLTRNGLNDWRDRDIVPVKEGEVTSFKFYQKGEPYISLVKEKDGEAWVFDQQQKVLPKGFRADKSALANLVRSSLNLKASGFVDEERDLKMPVAKFIVHDGEKNYEVLFYAGTNDTYLAKRTDDPQIYEISKFNFDRINKPIEDLRDLSLLRFDRSAVVKLSLMHGKDKIVLSKKDNAWHIDEPASLPAGFEFDPVAADDMLSMLSGLAAERPANLSKDQAQNPHWQNNWLLELTTDKGDKVHLYVGKSKAAKDEYLAKGNVDQEIYIVKGARISSVLSGLNAFKKEEFDLPPINENTKGFESLPVDVQRKLLDAAAKKKKL